MLDCASCALTKSEPADMNAPATTTTKLSLSSHRHHFGTVFATTEAIVANLDDATSMDQLPTNNCHVIPQQALVWLPVCCARVVPACRVPRTSRALCWMTKQPLQWCTPQQVLHGHSDLSHQPGRIPWSMMPACFLPPSSSSTIPGL